MRAAGRSNTTSAAMPPRHWLKSTGTVVHAQPNMPIAIDIHCGHYGYVFMPGDYKADFKLVPGSKVTVRWAFDNDCGCLCGLSCSLFYPEGTIQSQISNALDMYLADPMTGA